MNFRAICLFAAVMLGGAFSFEANASACSYAPAAWTVLHRGTTILTPANGPLAVVVRGYDNPFDTLPELTLDTFTVEVVDGAGLPVPGSIELIAGVDETSARVLFAPETPFEVDGTYQLTVTPADEFAVPLTLPLEVLADLGGLLPEVSWLSTTEVQRGAAERCCTTPEEDFACVMDSCGDYSHGEACRLCWHTANTYPIITSVDWLVASDVPSGYIDHHVYQVDGDTEELIGAFLAPMSAGAQWAEDHEGPFCVRVEITDVIRGQSASSEVMCVEAGVIERLERMAPAVAEFEARCEPGTIEDPEPDPMDNPPHPMDTDPPDDGSDGTKSEPGCCSTAPHGPRDLPALVLVLLGAFGLRRMDRRESR